MPAFGELQRDIRAARAPLLPAAMSEVAMQAGASRDAKQLGSLLSQYFLDDELQTGSGAKLRAVLDERTRLIKHISNDIALFGTQPEHERLLAAQMRSLRWCQLDVLNPYRQTAAICWPATRRPRALGPGVTDDQLDAGAALVACQDAVKREPRTGRLQFQLARALLGSDRPGEAITVLKQAADLQHGGVHFFLSEAYLNGAPSLPKNEELSAQHAEKARILGYADAGSGGKRRRANLRHRGLRRCKTHARGVFRRQLVDGGQRFYTFKYVVHRLSY
ncbi:MAG: hypothetical protein IPP36_06090 [Nitrosomonadales bacterium]|nr:hypothetical protein [Nitrosomonadales bacterium]